jgi:hypothetical protein
MGEIADRGGTYSVSERFCQEANEDKNTVSCFSPFADIG